MYDSSPSSPGSTVTILVSSSSIRSSLGWIQWLNVPNHLGVLINASVAGEETHPGHACDALCDPLLLVPVRLIDELVGLAVAVEVIRDQVVVSVLDNAIDQRREGARVAEGTFLDCIEHLSKTLVELVRPIDVTVAKVLNVLCEVAEEEDVVLPNFASNFNLE
jgi:hypothetical protein